MSRPVIAGSDANDWCRDRVFCVASSWREERGLLLRDDRGMKSDGEKLFSAYLRQRRLPFVYEPLIGSRRPDFVVSHPAGQVACDVYEPEVQLPTGRTFNFSSYPALRKSMHGQKYAQAKAARDAGLPFTVVLRRTLGGIPLDPIVVAGAMFGDLAAEFSVWLSPGPPPTEPAPESRMVFGGGGRLQEAMNRATSAVAILTTFNPTMWRVQRAHRERLDRLNASRPPSPRRQQAAADVINETYEHFAVTGEFDPEARLARLTVIHNPYCDLPIDWNIFGGPHDDQWGHLPVDGGAGCMLLAQGRFRWEVPN